MEKKEKMSKHHKQKIADFINRDERLKEIILNECHAPQLLLHIDIPAQVKLKIEKDVLYAVNKEKNMMMMKKVLEAVEKYQLADQLIYALEEIGQLRLAKKIKACLTESELPQPPSNLQEGFECSFRRSVDVQMAENQQRLGANPQHSMAGISVARPGDAAVARQLQQHQSGDISMASPTDLLLQPNPQYQQQNSMQYQQQSSHQGDMSTAHPADMFIRQHQSHLGTNTASMGGMLSNAAPVDQVINNEQVNPLPRRAAVGEPIIEIDYGDDDFWVEADMS